MEVDVDYFRAAVKSIVFVTIVWFLIANIVAKFKRVSLERKGWDELVAVAVRSVFLLGAVMLIVYFF